jgi:hypothetical protein
MRVVRVNCAQQSCQAACAVDEILITAYCGPARRSPAILNERAVSCGAVASAANSPLVAVCLRTEEQQR